MVVGVQVGDDLIAVVEVVGVVMGDIVHRGLGRGHIIGVHHWVPVYR